MSDEEEPLPEGLQESMVYDKVEPMQRAPGGGGGHSHNGVPCHGHGRPQQQHGHSHNGVPCHGHGQPQQQHGHSHNGVPCHGHGQPQQQHGHSHNGVPCHGHGQPQQQHGHSHQQHGHSHNGVPCHGHGRPQQQHGHSHNGVPCHGHGGQQQREPTADERLAQLQHALKQMQADVDSVKADNIPEKEDQLEEMELQLRIMKTMYAKLVRAKAKNMQVNQEEMQAIRLNGTIEQGKLQLKRLNKMRAEAVERDAKKADAAGDEAAAAVEAVDLEVSTDAAAATAGGGGHSHNGVPCHGHGPPSVDAIDAKIKETEDQLAKLAEAAAMTAEDRATKAQADQVKQLAAACDNMDDKIREVKKAAKKDNGKGVKGLPADVKLQIDSMQDQLAMMRVVRDALKSKPVKSIAELQRLSHEGMKTGIEMQIAKVEANTDDEHREQKLKVLNQKMKDHLAEMADFEEKVAQQEAAREGDEFKSKD